MKKLFLTLFIFGALGSAQARECYLGEVAMFGFDWAPRGWAKLEGQLLPINQNSALFSLLGTTYGGDGRTTFALPDLRGRVAIGSGNGNGLTSRRVGEKSGSETNNFNPNLEVKKVKVMKKQPDQPKVKVVKYIIDKPQANLNNMQPYLAMGYHMCLQGIYPSRN